MRSPFDGKVVAQVFQGTRENARQAVQAAVRAFEVHALDYLLKPFEYDRLHQSVERARIGLQTDSSEAYRNRILGLLENLGTQSQTWDRLVVRDEVRGGG